MDINNINAAMEAEVEVIVDDGLVQVEVSSLICVLLNISRASISCFATSPSKYVVPHLRYAAGHIFASFTNKIRLPAMPPARPRQPRTLGDWLLHFDSQVSKIVTYQTSQAHGQVLEAIASLYVDLLTACDAHGLEPRTRNPNRGQKS